MNKATVTICSSANFYKTAVSVQKQLEANGHLAIIPDTAEKMKQSGNYDPSHYRTWLKDASKYDKKTWLMRDHFKQIEKADVILVVNEIKHGVKDYIGGNVLIEMALAFYLNKPIYLLNDIPRKSNYLEEIIAMQPISLKGNLDKLLQA